MSLMKCPKCQNAVSDRASICPHCRHKLKIAINSYCVECGAELSPNDKVCKSCGFPVYNNIVPKKSSGRWKTVLLCCILSVILSLVTCIFAIFLFINGVVKANGGESILKTSDGESINIIWDAGKKEKSEQKKDTEPKVPTKTDFSVGEVAEYNGIQLTVTDYYISSGDEWASPPDGHVFLYMNVNVTNNSDEEITISSMASFESYCDDYKLDYDSDVYISDSTDGRQSLDGSIAPGKKMNGYLGLVVPTDWKKIELYYKDNVWLDSNFKFTINNSN